MSNHDEKDLLTQALHDRTTGVGGHPISLGDVKGRARTIKRRRNAITGAVAAVVAAVAIPTGMTVTTAINSPDSGRSPQVAASPDAPSVTPRADGSFPLTITDIPQGSPAKVDYLTDQGTTLVTPDGSRKLPTTFTQITPYNGGWIGLGQGKQGVVEIVHLDADLNVTLREPTAGDNLAVNADHSRVAYVVDSDGQTLLVEAPTNGTDPVTWPLEVNPNNDGPVHIAGFLDDSHIVWETQAGRNPMVASVGGEVDPLQGFLRVDGVSEAAGLLGGLVSWDDTQLQGGCYGVMDAGAGKLLWKTCDYRLKAFSPNGSYVVGETPEADGPGSPTLTVLDARTGEVVASFEPEKGSRTVAGVSQALWEDDDTLLAIVSEGLGVRMIRVHLDGRLEGVTATESGADMTMPLWFAEISR